MRGEKYYLDKFRNNDGYRLYNVPLENRTHAICFEAVKRNRRDFKHVPDEVKTYEMCLYLAQRGLMTMTDINEIPEQMRTEVRLYALNTAVKRGPLCFIKKPLAALEKLPNEPLSRELCHKAVANNPTVSPVLARFPGVTAVLI